MKAAYSTGTCLPSFRLHPQAAHRSPLAAQKNAVLERRSRVRLPPPHQEFWGGDGSVPDVSTQHCVLSCEGETSARCRGGRALLTAKQPSRTLLDHSRDLQPGDQRKHLAYRPFVLHRELVRMQCLASEQRGQITLLR